MVIKSVGEQKINQQGRKLKQDEIEYLLKGSYHCIAS